MRHWIRIGNLYINIQNIVDVAFADEYAYVRTVDGRKIAVYLDESSRDALIRYLSSQTDLYLAGVRNANEAQ